MLVYVSDVDIKMDSSGQDMCFHIGHRMTANLIKSEPSNIKQFVLHSV